MIMVDIIFKIHNQVAHVGIRKILKIVEEQFWHPAVNSIVRDVCVSCPHCQRYKSSSQLITPPVLKIQPAHPFDLVALDLLQFPRSSRGNIVLLVAIDHSSKFLIAVPLRNKTAHTVSEAFKSIVLPSMIRIPNRILTDNGPEFRAAEFNEIVDSFNILHIYSTRYMAASNGCVERSNQTIIQLLKGITADNPGDWDNKISRVLVMYNNTYHSQIGCSPAQFILRKSHDSTSAVPVNVETVNSWREGHAKFCSFTVGQKVAHKINRVGNLSRDKLAPKFEGPFLVTKVQSNGVTYEVRDNRGNIHKVHHRQLKEWNDFPRYLMKYLELTGHPKSRLTSGDEAGNLTDENAPNFDSVGMPFLSSSSCNSSSDDSDSGDDDSSSTCSSSSSSISSKDDSSIRSSSDINVPRQASEIQSHVNNDCQKSDDVSNNSRDDVVDSKVRRVEPGSQEAVGEIRDNVNHDLATTRDRVDGDDVERLDRSELNVGRQPEPKTSTPTRHGDIEFQVAESLSPIIRSSCSLADRNQSFFISWVEQSFGVQEELIDDALKELTVIESVNKMPQIHTPHYITDEVSFSGVGESVGVSRDASAVRSVLNIMKEQAARSRSIASRYQSDNNLLREIWVRRYRGSESRLDRYNWLESESSDVATELPVLITPAPEQRITRSRGNAENHPRVQPRVLEYRKYAKK